MKISELIEQLEVAKAEHGDLLVVVNSYDGGSCAYNNPQLTLVSVKASGRKPEWWEGEYTDDYAGPKNALCVDSAKRSEA